jgi:co-chaperonin GroES (HSP10)
MQTTKVHEEVHKTHVSLQTEFYDTSTIGDAYTNHIRETMFPEVNHGIVPKGANVLIQCKFIPSVSSGGIVLTDNTKKEEAYQCTIGKLVAMGALAYRDRQNPTKVWGEGKWADISDFVFVPKTGTRIVKTIEGEEYAFVLIPDTDIMAGFETLEGFNQFI